MTSTVQQLLAKVLVGLTLLLVCSGCATFEKLFKPKSEEASAETVSVPADETGSAEAAQFVHTVRWPGESLSLIAKWYTGSYKNWKALAEANPKLDPNRIRIGENIVIPEKLLKTRKQMPRDFVPSPSP